MAAELHTSYPYLKIGNITADHKGNSFMFLINTGANDVKNKGFIPEPSCTEDLHFSNIAFSHS